MVSEEPKLDLELYIQNYNGTPHLRLPVDIPHLAASILSIWTIPDPSSRAGRTRFDRLFHIGRTSTVLCVDALKAAVTEAKGGKDVNSYRIAVECLLEVAPDEPEAKIDTEWIEATEKANKKETQRLEAELVGYQRNFVKESVRVSLDTKYGPLPPPYPAGDRCRGIWDRVPDA